MQQYSSLQSHKVGALLTVRRDPYGREKGILVVEVGFSGAYGRLANTPLWPRLLPKTGGRVTHTVQPVGTLLQLVAGGMEAHVEVG